MRSVARRLGARARPPVVVSAMLAVAISPGRAAGAGAGGAAGEPTKDQCIDANEAAQTLTRSARLREAKRELLVCVAASCPGAVRDDCAQRLNDLEPKIPTLVFEVKDDHGGDLSAVRVTVDGQPLADRLDGMALAVDPGEHRFVFHADGHKDEERTLVVREGDKDRRERVVLVAEKTGGAPTGAGLPAATGGTPQGLQGAEGPPGSQAPARAGARDSAPGEGDGRTQRTVGLVLGGAGAAAVVVGTVFAFVSKSTYDTAFDDECHGDPHGCSPQGVQDGATAHGQAAVATVALFGGAALLGAGAYFYFTAPSGTVSVGPEVGNRSASLAVHGRW